MGHSWISRVNTNTGYKDSFISSFSRYLYKRSLHHRTYSYLRVREQDAKSIPRSRPIPVEISDQKFSSSKSVLIDLKEPRGTQIQQASASWMDAPGLKWKGEQFEVSKEEWDRMGLCALDLDLMPHSRFLEYAEKLSRTGDRLKCTFDPISIM